MSRCRIVEPLVRTIPISDGDSITVKQQLNTGETRAAYARMSVAGVDGAMHVDRLQLGMATVVAYLVDWTLVDTRGAVIPIRDQPADVVQAALESLDTDSFAEIRDAVEAHDDAVRKEREREKNGQGTPSDSVAI